MSEPYESGRIWYVGELDPFKVTAAVNPPAINTPVTP